MRLIFGDDWNDTPRSLRLFGNDVISLDLGSLMIFVYLYTCTQSIQKQIVEYDIKSRKYTEEYSSVDKVGPEILLARKSFFSVDLITSSYIVRWPDQGRSTQYLLLNIIYNCGFKIQPVDRIFFFFWQFKRTFLVHHVDQKLAHLTLFIAYAWVQNISKKFKAS